MGGNKISSATEMEEFLTTEEAAQMLRTTKAAIDNLCSRRKLTYFKLTKKRLFRKETLLKEVMEHSVNSLINI